jgi:hypothetical protein
VPADADLVIGLRWDRRREELYASLRFEIAGTNTDEWDQPDEPISIDLVRLRQLSMDEGAYGNALTDMVLRRADVEAFFQRALAVAEHEEATVHLRLHITAPAQFHALRWESLRDPRSGHPLATRSNVLFSRYLDSVDWRPVPAVAKHDLRALVAVAGPSDLEGYRPGGRSLAPVRVDDELERARIALAEFNDVTELAHGRATLAGVLDGLDKGVDVLYLVCHGALNDDVPLIYLEAPDGKAHLVDGRELVERLLALERRPIVVMLCSCQSVTAGTELWSADEGDLSALGPRLAAAGVSAVVGMQGNVSMTTAGTFAPAFFAALATDGIVDHAMAVARRAVRDRSDWWVPVLFSRLRAGRTYYRPQFTERADDTWETLRLQMRNGNFTPVLGPGLADSILGSRQDIARGFVERWQMPIAIHSQGDLAQVAQYLRVRSAPGTVRAQLIDHVSSEIAKRCENADTRSPFWQLPFDPKQPGAAILELGRRLRSADAGDPYRVMAALPVSVYVTTAWTDLLQDALRTADPPRDPVTRTFPWNDVLGGDGPDYLEEPTQERPLVYHLFGRLEHPRSLVLTEEDYFAWFSAWLTRRKEIPEVIPPSLLDKSLLFLGFRLDDWDFRVIFHSIKSFGGSALLSENVHIGVQFSPDNQMIEPEAAQEYLESYFGNDRVSIYWGEVRQFLDDLRKRTGLRT